ncbi:MAG: hypothetical protein OHK0052_25560 [Anaerolineales bacterium]
MARATLNKPAPDFIIKDFRGQSVQLSAYRDKKNVLLVFNRGFF